MLLFVVLFLGGGRWRLFVVPVFFCCVLVFSIYAFSLRFAHAPGPTPWAGMIRWRDSLGILFVGTRMKWRLTFGRNQQTEASLRLFFFHLDFARSSALYAAFDWSWLSVLLIFPVEVLPRGEVVNFCPNKEISPKPLTT